MANAGTVEISFAAETAKFTAELQKVNARLKSIEGAFQSLERVAKSALSALSVGAITAFVKHAADAADELGKTADKIGISTAGLKTFQIAAGEAGVSLETTNKILLESQQRLGEAAAGTGEAAKFIKLLGLNIKDLQRLSPDELFKTYSEAINGLANRSEQLAAANALMGKSAKEAFALIQAGAPAIQDAAAFVARFGLALDRVDIKQIEQANDALGRIGTVADSAGQRIAAGLAPAIEFFANTILDATGNTRDLQETAGKFAAAAVTAFELVANAAHSLQAAFFGLAAGGARVLQFLTFGDVSESFAASVDANLAKANEALTKIKSIEEIQQIIVKALEDSRAKAEAAVAEQQARDAAAKAGGLTISEDVIGLTQQQNFDIINEAAKASADAQKQIQREITDFTLDELQRRAEGYDNTAAFERATEAASQAQIIAFKQAGTNAAVSLLSAYGGKYKSFALGLLAIERGKAIATAVINTREAVTKALAAYPPPANFAAAAVVAAFGAAQVAAIASTFFGSSGSANIGAPSNPVFTQQTSLVDTQPQAVAAPQTSVQVIIQGNLIGNEEFIDDLISDIRDAVDDKDVVLIRPTSRNAKEIMGAT